ncbi:hypothetical protein GCM10009839_02660 [Catenulispora yoronensis]|uniref:Uncharacterized protein n=1 Tax=Catenulispora yoronensis TaxID=450799 RepID=A0ABP5EYJ4_9ACTN
MDLPAPFGPTMPVTRPGPRVNVTPRNAATGPKLLLTPETSTTAAGAAGVAPGGGVDVGVDEAEVEEETEDRGCCAMVAGVRGGR